MPKTKFGKWSVGLLVAVPVLFFLSTILMSLFYQNTPSGNSIMADFVNRPGLAIPIFLGMLSGISSFVTGVIALAKEKERSFLVYVSTFIGAIFILFLLGEVITPH